MRTIVLYPDKRLREKTAEVKAVDAALLKEIKELKETLTATEKTAAGLAATQIGFRRRFFGLKTDEKSDVQIFINPRIEATFGEKTYPIMIYEDGKQENFLEGCLSFPDLFGTVKRYLKIEVAWEEIEGKKLITKRKSMKGFPAIVFQHESEHLDGVLFVDHIKEEGGKIYRWGGETKTEIKIEEVIKEVISGK